MERVWLSTTYYMDKDVQGLSPNGERFLTRAIAYCGNAENRGNFTLSDAKMLGIPGAKSRIFELVSAGILNENSDGTWTFRNWSHWQESGNKLLERRKKDRERKAEKRAEEREMSADMSAKIRTQRREEKKREENSKEFSSSSHVSNASEFEDRASGPAVNVAGWKLVREVIPTEHPQASKTSLALEAGAMLKSGTTPDDVRAALALWLSKPHLGPRTLPSLVSEVIRNRNPTTATPLNSMSTADQRVAQAQALKNPPRLELT